jgi:hypothetical protein
MTFVQFDADTRQDLNSNSANNFQFTSTFDVHVITHLSSYYQFTTSQKFFNLEYQKCRDKPEYLTLYNKVCTVTQFIVMIHFGPYFTNIHIMKFILFIL